MQSLSKELINEIIRRFVIEFNPVRIILFGSYDWGNPGKDSDMDLLVIVDKSDLSPLKRASLAHRCLQGINITKDYL